MSNRHVSAPPSYVTNAVTGKRFRPTGSEGAPFVVSPATLRPDHSYFASDADDSNQRPLVHSFERKSTPSSKQQENPRSSSSSISLPSLLLLQQQRNPSDDDDDELLPLRFHEEDRLDLAELRDDGFRGPPTVDDDSPTMGGHDDHRYPGHHPGHHQYRLEASLSPPANSPLPISVAHTTVSSGGDGGNGHLPPRYAHHNYSLLSSDTAENGRRRHDTLHPRDDDQHHQQHRKEKEEHASSLGTNEDASSSPPGRTAVAASLFATTEDRTNKNDSATPSELEDDDDEEAVTGRQEMRKRRGIDDDDADELPSMPQLQRDFAELTSSLQEIMMQIQGLKNVAAAAAKKHKMVAEFDDETGKLIFSREERPNNAQHLRVPKVRWHDDVVRSSAVVEVPRTGQELPPEQKARNRENTESILRQNTALQRRLADEAISQARRSEHEDRNNNLRHDMREDEEDESTSLASPCPVMPRSSHQHQRPSSHVRLDGGQFTFERPVEDETWDDEKLCLKSYHNDARSPPREMSPPTLRVDVPTSLQKKPMIAVASNNGRPSFSSNARSTLPAVLGIVFTMQPIAADE